MAAKKKSTKKKSALVRVTGYSYTRTVKAHTRKAPKRKSRAKK